MEHLGGVLDTYLPIWKSWLVVGILVVAFVELCLVRLLTFTHGHDTYLKGQQVRILPNAPLLRALARIVYIFGGVAVTIVVYQIWGDRVGELELTDAILFGMTTVGAFGVRWFNERWRIAMSHRLIPGMSISIIDGDKIIHRMICSLHLGHVMLEDPRTSHGEDITRIPMAWLLSKAVTNHGPYGQQYVIRHQIKAKGCGPKQMARLCASLSDSLPRVDPELRIYKIGWEGNENTFEVRVRIERTDFAARDRAYREVAQLVMKTIKSCRLTIHDQNQ